MAIDGRCVVDPEFPTCAGSRITLDGKPVGRAEPLYIAFNKPRGLITSAHDERGRDTVYASLSDAALPWLAPVGRLDKASEGLLLFTNDTRWAAQVTDPDRNVRKIYHVQIDRLSDPALLRELEQGIEVGTAGRLSVAAARVLRSGAKHAWLELALSEGRNRQIRRLLEARDIRVLRLVRIAIGGVVLGDLAKGQWRRIEPASVFEAAPGRAP